MGPVRKPVRRFFKSFAQAYEPFRLTVLPACFVPVSISHSLLHQPVVTSAPLPDVSPVRIATATFPSHIPNICQTNAPIQSFSSKLKTSSSFELSLSSHQKYAPTAATRSPYSAYHACVSSLSSPPAICIVSDDFNDFRSLLIFSNNSIVNVDVHVNVDNYLNRKFYDHDFQSKAESNSKNPCRRSSSQSLV